MMKKEDLLGSSFSNAFEILKIFNMPPHTDTDIIREIDTHTFALAPRPSPPSPKVCRQVPRVQVRDPSDQMLK
jgi:hypothetical protein